MVKVAFDSCYAHPLPEGHRFPMIKYELIPEQLMYEGTYAQHDFFKPKPCDDEWILKAHTAEYLHKLKHLQLTASEMRKIGFPLSADLVHRELIITQGTIDCCKYAKEFGVSLNIAGGTHHAFADRGEGFCLLNDMAVAAHYLLQTKQAKRILIVDLDVHQGNGTASIFSGSQQVFTFSMHGKHNYPFHKEVSTSDVPLIDGTTTHEYLQILDAYLPKIIQQFKPDFAFYLSGVDILDTDKFGKLKVSLDGCKQRDEYVFSTLKVHHIPIVVAMGGGYSEDVRIIVEAHCNTFRLAKKLFD